MIIRIRKSEHLYNLIEIMEFGYMNNRFISVNLEYKENLIRSWLVLHKGCMPAQQNFQNA